MHRAFSRLFRVNVMAGLAVAAGLAAFASAGAACAQGTAAAGAASSSTTDPNAATLFPNGGVTPAPELEENRQAAGKRQATGKRGKGGKGGRKTDVLATRAATDPLEVRIAFRKAKTEAMLRNPQIAILEREADVASTDDEKRAYLRSYYTQLYAAVRKIDPSPAMASHVQLLNAVAEQRYDPKRRTVGGDEDLVRGRRGRNKKR